ncbi:uncharacterized protein METZ01_LOCUS277843 [marine metagenome]|uniref:Uncharacterized protein n=1 Tax=marine metagenome TaxID=408172 RepID=A0A382KL72_9ZZZZ
MARVPKVEYTSRLLSPPIAQLDRAPGFEPGCREFESLWAGHFYIGLANHRLSKTVPLTITRFAFGWLGLHNYCIDRD